MLDTSHPAGAAGERTRDEDAYREVLRDATTDETGLITFASCWPRERGLGSEAWGGSAFTKALVEGLTGKADANRDGTVTLAELDAYVADRVQELTAGRQHPTTQRPPSIRGNLPLALVQ